jgi:hypothetical protein
MAQKIVRAAKQHDPDRRRLRWTIQPDPPISSTFSDRIDGTVAVCAPFSLRPKRKSPADEAAISGWIASLEGHVMLADRYGLPVTTASQSARDAFIEGYERLFMVLPTARAAFEAATAEDPNFVLAHLGAAQAAALQGDIAKMQASLAAAKAADVRLTEREASQLAFFVKLLTGQTHAALAAAAAHVETWPRDGVRPWGWTYWLR